MNAWVLLPCGFGFWWLASGLSAVGLLSAWSDIALIAVASVVAACGFVRRGSTRLVDRRMFRLGVLAEGAGIAVVVPACAVSSRPDLIMPLVGAVVGLHFLPLGKAFGDRRLVLAACAMTCVCLASLSWPVPVRTAIAGIGAGIVLWGFAVWTSLRQEPAGSPSMVPGRSSGRDGAS